MAVAYHVGFGSGGRSLEFRLALSSDGRAGTMLAVAPGCMRSTGSPEYQIAPVSESGVALVATRAPHLAQLDSRRLAQPTVMLWLLCSLLSTAVLLFLGFSWSGYRAAHPAAESFRVGGTQLVEITLVREDAQNLACASDLRAGGLRCGFDSSEQRVQSLDERHTLSPYSTVKNELLLAAGLWSNLLPHEQLPSKRFTVVCNFHVTSVIKSAALRWAQNGKFAALERSVALGFVSDCVIPP